MEKSSDILLIDVFKVVNILIQNIIPIALITIILATVGYFYSSKKIDSYKGKSNIYISDNFSFQLLDQYYETIIDLTLSLEEKKVKKNPTSLQADSFSKFVKIVSQGKHLEKNYYEYFLNNSNDDIKSRDLAIANVQSFNFSKIQNEIEDKVSFTFLTDDIEMSKKVISKTVDDINATIIDNIRQKYKMQVENSLMLLNNDINIISSNLDSLKYSAKQMHESELTYLKEQKEIAKILGIEDYSYNIKVANAQIEQTGIGVSLSRESPVYLQGHKAISKLILLMENRSLDTIYNMYPEKSRSISSENNRIMEMNNKINLIKTVDTKINKILSNENLKVIEYDSGYNTYVSQISLPRDVVTFGLIGFLISSISILYLKYSRQ